MEEEANPNRDESFAGGEGERFRDAVGLPFPFFLKNGTLICSSVDAIVVRLEPLNL